MGWLSKTFKKIVKSVKKVAKAVVKPFKKIAGKLMKGVNKVFGKWAPLAMMAVSFFSGGIGSMLSSAWEGFGSLAAGAAGSTNAIVSAMGNMGSAVFNAGNAVGGFIGSISDGISKGFTDLSKGNFASAGDAISDGFSNAFSGEASAKAVSDASFKAFQSSTNNAGFALENTSSATAGADAFQNKDAINFDTFDPVEPGSLIGGESPIGDLATQDFTTPKVPSVTDTVDISAADKLFESNTGNKLGTQAKKALKNAFAPDPQQPFQEFQPLQGVDTSAQGFLTRAGGQTSGGGLLGGVAGLGEAMETSRRQFQGGF